MKLKVLWIDDDDLILGAAKRLLEFHGISILTSNNPQEALDILSKNEVNVVVSDQRMPLTTGIELLSTVKEKYPLITKILVTGFSDENLFEEAVNRAGVFRFITKPWNDLDLISDLQAAFLHYQKINDNLRLRKEMKSQNALLGDLSSNLENIVFQRTQEIQTTKIELERKNLSIKNLVSFTEESHEINHVDDILLFLNKEMSKKLGITAVYIYYEDALKICNLLYIQKNDVISRKLAEPLKNNIEIKFNANEDKDFLLSNLKKPIGKIISMPILRSKKRGSSSAVIFIEHELSEAHVKNVLEYLTQRYQIISMTIDRVLAHQRLELDSQRWAQTYDFLSDGLCIIDEDGLMIRANEKFESAIQHVYKDELEKLKKENVCVIKRGSFIFESYIYLIPIENEKTNFILYFRDVTEEKRAYENMIQNEKMAALGLLAGNIAHELNNPLTGIRSLSQILLLEVKNESYRNDLFEIEKSALRCQSVIRELLDFTKKNPLEVRERISLFSLITRTLPFLKTALRSHNIQIHFNEKSDFFVVSNFQILQQIVFNLLINACQAMDDGGTVAISAEKNKEMILLKIKDTGKGMTEDVKDRIFDPFFTTKKEGEGTGIGLSFSKKMIESLGGSIYFTSEYGKGTEFVVEVPVDE